MKEVREALDNLRQHIEQAQKAFKNYKQVAEEFKELCLAEKKPANNPTNNTKQI